MALKGLTTLISLKFYVLMLISWSGDACIIESWWCWFESDWWKPFILVGSTLVKKIGFFMNDMKTWYIHSFKRWVERLKSLRVFYPNSWEAFFSLNCLQVCFFMGLCKLDNKFIDTQVDRCISSFLKLYVCDLNIYI